MYGGQLPDTDHAFKIKVIFFLLLQLPILTIRATNIKARRARGG
jgi:hypothetical protein